jgi:hypothetical protein
MKKNQIFILITFAVLIISSCKNKTDRGQGDTADKIQSVIKPPVENVNIPYVNYSIDANKDTTFTYSRTGSNIHVPENAFLDSTGKVVEGEVNLEYREFANAFDIYLAGVPMQYDSAGNEMVFETAGMLEINATSGGEPVFVNPENKIRVEMNSFHSGKQYNLYHLDTATGEWTNIGKDSVMQKNHDEELSELPEVPPKPRKAGNYSFSVEDTTGKCPELADYENVLFDPVDGQSCGYNATKIEVKELHSGKYEVTFIVKYEGTLVNEEKCICYLAFKEGADYNNAMNVYQRKYKSLIEKRRKMKKQIEEKWEQYYKIRQKYADAGVLDLFYKKEVRNTKGKNKIIRSLEISNFGFVNIDCPSDYPQGAALTAHFKDKNGNSLRLSNVVLVERGRDALFRYKKVIRFNPAKENILWGITQNGKLAYYTTEGFQSIDQKNGDFNFTMNIHQKELKSYEDIMEVLFL